MSDIITVAKERADKCGVKNVVVSLLSGATAEAVHEVFGLGYNIIAVGNPVSAHERRLVIHKGVTAETRERLERKGIKVVLQDQSLGQAAGIGGQLFDVDGAQFDIWGHYFHEAPLDEVIEKAGKDPRFNAVAIAFHVLHWFGDGPRVCIEVTLMAADSGVLPLDADCIAIARPWPQSNCPHAALVLRPCRSRDIFRDRLRVKDIALVPGPYDHWFNNGPLWAGVPAQSS